jgi:hypothetical protein
MTSEQSHGEGPRGPFGGEGRAPGTSREAMQMTAREGVAGRGLMCSPPTLPGRERSTPASSGRAAQSATCAARRDHRMIRHRGMSTIRSAGTQRLWAMGASPSATSYRHVMTPREGAATHCTGWISKGDLLGCTGLRPVPSLRIRKGLNEQEKHPGDQSPMYRSLTRVGTRGRPPLCATASCSPPRRRRP